MVQFREQSRSEFQIGLTFFTRPILKSLARLLPELYSTRSNYYYLKMQLSNSVIFIYRNGGLYGVP